MVGAVVEIALVGVEIVTSRVSVKVVDAMCVVEIALHVLGRVAFAEVVAVDVESLLD